MSKIGPILASEWAKVEAAKLRQKSCLRMVYRSDIQRLVPCGKCDSCRHLHGQHWIGRINAEAFLSELVLFATFTRSPTGRADHEAYRVWRRRVRRRDVDFKALSVVETGTKGGLQHVHALLLIKNGAAWDIPIDCQIYDPKLSLWPHGMAKFELPRSKTAAAWYLYDYVNKPGNKVVPSNGMGKEYLFRHAQMRGRNGRRLAPMGSTGMMYSVPGCRTGKKGEGPLWRFHFPARHPWFPDIIAAYLQGWDERGETCPLDYFQAVNGDY